MKVYVVLVPPPPPPPVGIDDIFPKACALPPPPHAITPLPPLLSGGHRRPLLQGGQRQLGDGA